VSSRAAVLAGVRDLHRRLGEGLTALENLKPEGQAVPASVDEAALAGVIRGMLAGRETRPMQQAEWDAIRAALLGKVAPPPAKSKAAGAIGLTRADFEWAGAQLGGTNPYPKIRAVDEVESGGGWFTDVRASILDLDGPGGFLDGPHLPKILFEAHIFDRETKGVHRAKHPNLSSPRWNKALYVGGQGEYERLHRAMQLDRRAALRSASWGRYQIMGFNHKAAGFATVEAFVDAMKEGERRHLEAFVAFIKSNKLVDAFRAISDDPEGCRAFAKGYNGAGYEKNNYHRKLANAHRKHRLASA
jgi:hypothetical protein